MGQDGTRRCSLLTWTYGMLQHSDCQLHVLGLISPVMAVSALRRLLGVHAGTAQNNTGVEGRLEFSLTPALIGF